MTKKNPLAGKPANRGKRVSEAEFRRMWMDVTLSTVEIGARLGISAAAVCSRAKTRGLPSRNGGSALKVRPITDPEFPAMYRMGVSLTEMADLYRCSRTHIRLEALRLGQAPRNCRGMGQTISIAEYRQRRILQALAKSAAREQSLIIHCEMADRRHGDNRAVGALHARGAV